MDVEEVRTPDGVLKALFHHIALPAMLPRGSESNTEDIERGILDRLIIAAKLMESVVDIYWQIWNSVRRSLLACKALNVGGKLERTHLTSYLKQLGDSDFVILHVGAQNAGLLIYKPTK